MGNMAGFGVRIQKLCVRTLPILAAIAFSHPAKAGNAAFSADSKTVYVAPFLSSLFAWDVAAPPGAEWREVQIDLGDGKDKEIFGVALAKDGDFLLLCGTSLHLWSPGRKKAELLETAPEGATFGDIACNPATDEIIITSGESLYYKQDRKSEMLEVNIRYPPGKKLSAPVFLKDGSFLFSADGDIWAGFLDPPTEGLVNLVACRFAPLATRETYDGSPIESGVNGMAVSQGKIYAEHSRMGGSGWGTLIRLEIPKRKGGLPANTAHASAKVLETVEEVENTGSYTFLCSSPDGRIIFFSPYMNAEAWRDQTPTFIFDDALENAPDKKITVENPCGFTSLEWILGDGEKNPDAFLKKRGESGPALKGSARKFLDWDNVAEIFVLHNTWHLPAVPKDIRVRHIEETLLDASFGDRVKGKNIGGSYVMLLKYRGGDRVVLLAFVEGLFIVEGSEGVAVGVVDTRGGR